MKLGTWIYWWTLAIVSATEYGAPRCKISEFECRGSTSRNKCISGELYCDGRDNCGDRSDEPLGCTPCNRTYYGEVGRSYRLSIPRPRANKLPLVCDLHFVAKHGEIYGDLIQLTLEEFKLGRFRDSHTAGCPDGHLRLLDGMSPREVNRDTEDDSVGQFCGSVSKIRPVYVSETEELTASIRFFHFYGSGIPENDFAFRIKYKFLRSSRAKSRYEDVHHAESTFRNYRGVKCSVNFTNCSQKHCRLRSPNYPGIYPRNSTCLYRILISPDEVPPGKKAFVSVNQPSDLKTHVLMAPKKKAGHGSGDIKEESYLFFGGRKEDESLGLFYECGDDSVTIHDGLDETDPILITFCRGDSIPKIVSSSNSGMLVIFRSSPFGVPDMEPFTLNGFDLHAEVIFKDQGSILASRTKEDCRFVIRSGSRPHLGVHNGTKTSGIVQNVDHRLVSARNRSCFYEFIGNPGEILWITFLKFKIVYDKNNLYRRPPPRCIHRITFHEEDNEEKEALNTSYVREFCETNPPNLCDHGYLQFNRENQEFRFRNCWKRKNESYIFTNGRVTLVETLLELHSGSVLHFKFRYEFVDVGQGGTAIKRERPRSREDVVVNRSPILHRDSSSNPTQELLLLDDRSGGGEGGVREGGGGPFQERHPDMASEEIRTNGRFPSCHRLFNSNASSRKRQKRFFTTKNVFFFGRGSGRRHLQCSYTFRGLPGERVLLRISRLNLYNQVACWAIPDSFGITDHFVCSRNQTGGTTSEIHVSEIPDPDDGMPLRQFCLCGSGQGNFLSNTSTLRLDLFVSDMNPYADYSQFLVEGSYEFIHEPLCRLTKIISDRTSGVIEFRDRPDCQRQPWVLKTTSSNGYLYLRVPGYVMTDPSFCSHARNRIVIHRSPRERLVICPSGLHFTDVFSLGWELEENEMSGNLKGGSLIIEFSVSDRAQMRDLSIHWLEVWKPLTRKSHLDPSLKIESLNKKKKKRKKNRNEVEEPPICDEYCSEIKACISPILWCDGIPHCPSSGIDESEENCSHVLLPSAYYYGLSSLVGISCFVLAFLVAYRFRIWWTHRGKDSATRVVSSKTRRRRPYSAGNEPSLTNISGTLETTVFTHPYVESQEDAYS